MAQQVQHSSDNVCCESEDKSRSAIGQLAFGRALRGTAAENGLAAIATGQTVPTVVPGRVRCFSSINVYDRTCPLPMIQRLVFTPGPTRREHFAVGIHKPVKMG